MEDPRTERLLPQRGGGGEGWEMGSSAEWLAEAHAQEEVVDARRIETGVKFRAHWSPGMPFVRP